MRRKDAELVFLLPCAGARKLGEAFEETFIVDNRPGAGGQVALEIMSTAASDGYTLLMISATTVVHPLLYKSRFDIVRDFTPLSQVTAQGYALVWLDRPCENAGDHRQSSCLGS